MQRIDVYVAEHCFGCEEARHLALAAASRFAQLSVRIVDLEREPDARPESLVAVPSYVLDGKVISLGNPRQMDLFSTLAQPLQARSVEEDSDGSP